MLWPNGRPVLRHFNLVDASIRAAERSPRAFTAMVHDKRSLRIATAKPYLVMKAKAAPLPAGTSRPFMQGILFEQHGVTLFENLDRR